MGMEFTNRKEYYQINSVNERLIRVEKILQQLFEYSSNNQKNDINIDIKSNLLESILSTSNKLEQETHLHKTVTIPEFLSENNKKYNKNSMLLSRMQVITQMASAIMRANSRNL